MKKISGEKYLRVIMTVMVGMLVLNLTGCTIKLEGTELKISSSTEEAKDTQESAQDTPAPEQSTQEPAQDTPAPEQSTQEPAQDTPAPVQDTSEAVGKTAVLYVGTRENGFAEYSLNYEGNLTPEILIAGIADLTGWDLSLAEPVTMGKGGMSVCLSSSSSLFVGPPENQKEEFHMFGAEQMAQTVLDSIQKTLQMGFTGEGGDPDALDVYYYMAGEQPLELPNLGITLPMDESYTWDNMR